MPGGFQTVAVVGFFAPLAVTLLGPAVGQALDRTPRLQGLSVVVISQGIFIALSGGLTPHLLYLLPIEV